MKHFVSPQFWKHYYKLSPSIQNLADKNFELLKKNPNHPSLRLKRVGRYWSARVGLHYRVLAVKIPEGVLWFWIGKHDEYDILLGKK